MSGKYGSKNEVKTALGNLNVSHNSIFNALKGYNPNYATAAIGKWHISQPINIQDPTLHGADHYMGILGAGWPAYDDWDKPKTVPQQIQMNMPQVILLITPLTGLITKLNHGCYGWHILLLTHPFTFHFLTSTVNHQPTLN
jgi:hypothetical protein